MYKLFSKFLTQVLIHSFFQGIAFSQFIFAFLKRRISSSMNAFKAVNRRALSMISTTVILAVFMTACGGGGGGSSTDTSPPTNVEPAPTLTVSSSRFTFSEDFTSTPAIASATSATSITVVESTTGVVNVAATTSSVMLSSILNANGRTTLTITARSGSLSSQPQTVVIEVTAVNDPAIITVANAAVTVNENFATATVATASDVEGNLLIISVAESSTGVVTVTTLNSGVQIASILNATGATTLTITVNDGTVDSTAQVAVQVSPVTVNNAPSLIIPSTTLTFTENFVGAQSVATASDVDGNALTISVVESATGVVTVTTSASGVQVTSIANSTGVTTLTITVNDGTVSTTGQVVIQVRDAPPLTTPTFSLVISNLIVSEDFATAQSIVNSTNATAITVSLSSTGVVNVSTSGISVSVSSILNANGRTTLTITATNGTLTATTQVTVTVNAVNDPTTLAVSTTALSLTEDFGSPISINTTITNVDGDTLVLTVVESSTGVVTVTTSASGVQVAPILNANGQTTLTITVNDGTADTTAQVVVTVTAVNDLPTFTVSTAALTLTEDFGSTQLITVISTDVDSTNLSLSVANANPGVVTVTTSASGVQVAPILNANGQTTLTITVRDEVSSTSTEVVVRVIAVNDAPTFTVSTAALTLTEDFGTTQLITVISTDVDSTNLSLSVANANTSVVSVTTTASGVQVAPILNANGQTILTITVNDGTSDTTAQVVVTVEATNDPTTLAVSTTSLSLTEDFGSVVSINTTITNVDGDTLVLTVAESNTGVVTVTTSASGVQVAPILNANGQTTLTITVNDGTSDITAQVVVTVAAANDPTNLAVSTTALSLTENFGSAVSINTTITNVDGDTLTLTVAESTTGVVTVTNSASGVQVASILNANGQTTLTITVNDGTSDTTAQVVVTVSAVNNPPTFTVSTAALTLTEDFGSTQLITVISTDVDSTNLSLSVANADPSVVSVTTSASGVQVAPILNANGQTTLTITVRDELTSTSTEVVVRVTELNDPPTFTVSTAALTLTEDFGSTQLITVISTDVDSTNLSLSVANANPSVVTVTTSASGVQVAPILNANGQTTLTITVNDGTADATAQVVVTVEAVNDPPTFTVSTVALRLTENFGSTQLITVISTDVDSTNLSLSVANSNPSVVSVTTSASGIQVAPINNASGQTTLTITVNDGTSDTTTQVVVTVSAVNDPPTFTVSTAALTLTEDFGSTQLITVSITDIDSTNLSLSVANANPSVVTVTTSTLGVQVVPINNANGQTTLTITVRDEVSSTSTEVVVRVIAVNDPPTFTVSTAGLTLTEDFGSTQLITVISTDVDSTNLSLSVANSNPSVVTVTTSASSIQVAPILNANGQTTLTITVNDGTSDTTAQVVVTVEAVNDPPTFTVSTVALRLTENFGSTQLVTVISTDVDSTNLSLSVANSNPSVVSVTASTSGIQVAPINNASGQTTLTITVNDGTSDTTAQVVVTVSAVNNPPTFTVSTAALTLTEDFGSTQLITVTITDVDSTNLSLSVANADPSVVTVTTSASGIQVAPINNVSGQTTLTITVRDEVSSTSTEVVVRVIAVNDPPTFTVSTAALTLSEDFGSTQLITVISTDVDSTNLSMSVANANPSVVSVTTSASSIQVAPINNANGQTTLTITVRDEVNSTSTDVVVRVIAVNDPPTLAVTTNSISLISGFSVISIGVTARDVEDTALSFTVLESTTGVVNVSTNSSAISLNPSSNSTGSTTLTVRVVDSSGATVVQTISVNVSSIPSVPPVLMVSTNRISVLEDFMSSIIIRTTATDANGDTITLSVSQSALVNATISAPVSGGSTLNNTITLSAVGDANGVTTLTIQARDSGGEIATTIVVVTVAAVSDTPTITVSSNSITAFGGFSTITINTTANDADEGVLSFTVTESMLGVVRVTTSANAITLNSISGVIGQTTLTVRTVDSSGIAVSHTIAVNVVNSPPVLMVSTTRISLQEDFMTSVSFSVTAMDNEGDTITISVSSSTRLVDAVVSTLTNGMSTITLSSVANEFGITTLTVHATDAAGQSNSTIIVMALAAVNDTPTITVSSNSVSLGAAALDLIVTAYDVEDSTLTFSVSTGQGLVNTVISGDRLTLTRSGVNVSQITLTLTTTDTGNVSVSTVVTVALPPALFVTTSVKTLNFSWSAISTATHYQLESEPRSGSGFTVLNTTGIVVIPNTTISRTTAQGQVSLHRYVPRVDNPIYAVKTCDATSCEASHRHSVSMFSNSDLNSMIGQLRGSNTTTTDQFGHSISLSDDGNTLAVGAPTEAGSSTGVNQPINTNAANSGAVYVFRRNGGVWSQQAYIKASNAEVNDEFGQSVSLSNDGNTLAVGARFEGSASTAINGAQLNGAPQSGAVYLFRFSGGAWLQQAYIKPLNTNSRDNFGFSVSLSGDGNTLAVGAIEENSSLAGVNRPDNNDSNTPSAGAAYVFRFTTGSNTWTQQAYIKTFIPVFGALFGSAVHLSDDGNTLAASAETEPTIGRGINQPPIMGVDDGEGGGEGGAVYVFRFNSTSTIWSQQAYIKAHNADESDRFGSSLSISDDGNTLAVGAHAEGSSSTGVGSNGGDNNVVNSGAAYVFQVSTAGTWIQQAYIKASNTDGSDEFGWSISLSGNGMFLAVGARHERGSSVGINGLESSNGTFRSGAVYFFELNNGNWSQRAYVKPSNNLIRNVFGASVSLNKDGSSLIVGASRVLVTISEARDAPSVYLY